ncbi:hypothetical protein NQ315_004178 [Exocentrus adspersus]|uniref:Uncharacterized protein n=1 Tax=Exocentrus adspersus TaxID=1586481 RepID=A0AAV8W8Q3_9CUCU|nr:hypothetical protein NQ315_004178 [Exocentrus adspersus]
MYNSANHIITTSNAPLPEEAKGGMGHFCFNFMKIHKDKVAEIDASTGQEETFGSMLIKSVRISLMLQKKGIRKGDLVIIYSKMQLNAGVPILSCFFIGAIPVYIDAFLTRAEIINLLKQVDPKLVLTTDELAETVQSIMEKDIRSDASIMVYDSDYDKEQEGEEGFKPIYIEDLKEVVTISLSSGTTGLSKGILLDHYSSLRRSGLNYEGLWKENQRKMIFSLDSFHWVLELNRFIISIAQGFCRLIDPALPFDPTRVWNLLADYKINVAGLIPYFIVEMCRVGIPKGLDLSSLTTICVVGSSTSKNYHKQMQELLPNVDVLLVYGQTETGVLSTFRKCDLHRAYNRRKLGSVGVPYEGVGLSYKVVDITTEKNVGPNEMGELRVKGDVLLSGYHNLDSSSQFDEDGWLKTGDLVIFDEDLCFFILDRIKDLIIFQGWHVPPAFIENELLTHPSVKKVAVIGIPNETDGEHPMGLVVLKDKREGVTPEEIQKYIAERMEDRFHLRAGVKFIDGSYFDDKKKTKRYYLKKMVLSGQL